MTEPHFTPRKVIELTLANAPDDSTGFHHDPCAGTAAFSIMAMTAAEAANKDSRNA